MSLISNLRDDEGNFHFVGDISGHGRSGSKIFLDVVKPYEERADMRFFIMNHFFSQQMTSTQMDQWDDLKSSGSFIIYYKNHWLYCILFFCFFHRLTLFVWLILNETLLGLQRRLVWMSVLWWRGKESFHNSARPLEAIVVATITHWGQVTHICVDKLTIIGSDNDLSPGRCQAIIWTNAGIMLIGPLGTNFSEIVIEIYIFLLKKMHLENGVHFVSAWMW